MNGSYNMNEKLSELVRKCGDMKRLSAIKRHPDYHLLVEATQFLPSEAPIAQRLWHVQNDKYEPQTCTQCDTLVSWRKSNGGFYSRTCSTKCDKQDGHRMRKIQATNLERYGCTSAFGSKLVQQKTTSTIKNKYGVDNISQLPEIRQKKSEAAFNARNTHISSKHIIESLISQGKTQQEIGQVLGITQERTCSLLAKLGLKTNTTPMSSSVQREICDFLSQYGVIEENNTSVLYPKHLDILMPGKRLAIEINGVYWHGELAGKHRMYHFDKYRSCLLQHIRLIQIYDTEWHRSQDIVKSVLRMSCGVATCKIWARQTHIQQLDVHTERDFLANNHIQGYTPSTVCIGLYHNTQLVALMSFGRNRFGGQGDVEMLRYVCLLDTAVVGGAEKLFSHYIKTYQPKHIISYSDNRWFSGQMYQRLGFKNIGCTSPNYKYINRNGDTSILYNRIRFQKHKLLGIFGDAFDASETEWENMKRCGYDRIWDCGNNRWLWTQ